MKGTNHKGASRRIAKRPEGTSSGMGKTTKQPKAHSVWSATGRGRIAKDGEG